jgi:hypothetical protein
MSAMRRRSRLAFATPVLLVSLALAPLAAGLLPTAPAAADTPALPIQVSLSTLRPVAPQPGDTLVVSGTLRNTSDFPIVNVAYELKLAEEPVGSRSEFQQYADDPDGSLEDQPREFNPATAVSEGVPLTLAPGETEHFALSVAFTPTILSTFDLPTNEWQVRELGISVTGYLNGSTVLAVVGSLRTFLPWAPRTVAEKPVQLAWIWPLVDRPHRTVASTWFDDKLAPEISSTAGDSGRLSALLDAGLAAEGQQTGGRHPTTGDVPVTWAIDPMLVSDVQAMVPGYRVTTPTGTVAGTGAAAAKTWLSSLGEALNNPNASILPLPYADPDVVAAGRFNGFVTAIGLAAADGRTLLQHSFASATLLPYGWPFDGLANQRALSLLTATGDHTVVLSDTAVPVVGVPPPVTPSAHTEITTTDGPVDTLLTDFGLSADVTSGVNDQNGSRLAVQRFLAEALMIQAESPDTQRDLVVAPNRRWNPPPAYAAQLLADTGKVPWIQPVSLSQVDASPIDKSVQRRALTYPNSARRDELSSAYLGQVAALRAQISDFGSILPAGNAQSPIGSYTTAAQEALSSAWRQQPGLASKQVAALASTVEKQMKQVRISSNTGSYVTLTSHGGKVPVTISNNLATDVRVTVKLTGDRLALSNHGQVLDVTVPAHQQTVVNIHAAAKTSGVFPVKVRLLTPSGRPYGPIVSLFIRSTAYGTITLIITGAATAALLVAVAIRLTRRALAARRGAASAAT